MTGWLRERDGAVEVAVKAVPNASRDRIVGLHGDRLKVAVAAPPEKGKANDRIAQVLAQAVGVATRQVTLVGGGSAAQKTFAIRGTSLAEVRARLLPAGP